jgi:predicted esterase
MVIQKTTNINYFTEVEIFPNSLYVFDIDDTILFFPELPINFWENTFEIEYSKDSDYDKSTERTMNTWIDHISNHVPVCTNIMGLSLLIEKLSAVNSKIMYVTARPKSLHQLTVKQLKDMNMQLVSYNNIHCIGDANKGEFILEHARETTYANIIFLDDMQYNIDDVIVAIPSAICYKFNNPKINDLSKAVTSYNLTVNNVMEYDGYKRRNLEDDRFYIYNKKKESAEYDVLIFYHGSRDLAWEQVHETGLLELEFTNPTIVIFGQCSGVSKYPCFHKDYHNIEFGEIYWEIRDQDEQFTKDLNYTKNVIADIKTLYRINNIFHVGHSNGGVFNLQLAIHMPTVFTCLVSHNGGLGFDFQYYLDFVLISDVEYKVPILFITGEFDVHKLPCQQAKLLFENEGFDDIQYIEHPNTLHFYCKSHEDNMLTFINKCLSKK